MLLPKIFLKIEINTNFSFLKNTKREKRIEKIFPYILLSCEKYKRK